MTFDARAFPSLLRRARPLAHAATALFVVIAGSPIVGAAAAPPAPAAPAWLVTLNKIREASGLDPVVEEPAWTKSIADHLDYLALTDPSLRTGAYATVHAENPESAWFTPEGKVAAASTVLGYGFTEREAIENFFTAPFHAISLLRPGLRRVAFSMRGTAAALDVSRGWVDDRSTTPVLFPGDRSMTTLNGFAGVESPDPLESCPGFTAPSGLPIVALLPNSPKPLVTATITGPNGRDLASKDVCVITQYTVRTSDPVYGASAAATLASDQAAVIVPRNPLKSGTYRIQLLQPNTDPIVWAFTVEAPRPGTTFGPVSPGRPLRFSVGAQQTIVGTLTVDQPVADGFATVYPCADARPTTSNINFVAGRTVAAAFVARGDGDGNVCVAVSARTDVIVDRVAGTEKPLAHRPERDIDTRTTSPLKAGEIRALHLRSKPGTTVLGTVTVADAGDDGYLSIGPCDASLGRTSNVNFSRGVNAANLFVAVTDAAGNVCVLSSASTHVLVDRSAETTASVLPSPERRVDTRTSSALVPGVPLQVPSGGTTSVFGSVAAVDPQAAGYLTVFRCDQAIPSTSNVNFEAGITIANAFHAAVDKGGDVCVVSSAPTHVVLDVLAYGTTFTCLEPPVREVDTRAGVHAYEPFPL